MKQYLDLLRDVRNNGVRKPTRAKLISTGTNVDAFSVFGRQMRFDLSDGFPLVTTKKVDFESIAHELIWFISGSTNIKYLKDNKVNIWNEWADEDGEIGESYGFNWRRFGERDGRKGKDQLVELSQNIYHVKRHPIASVGRRLIISAWDALNANSLNLPPCHVMAQFNVTDDKLSCALFQRSADMFLGVPYNIASYSLLTYMLASINCLGVGEFVHFIGDAHIYENHLDQVNEQLSRSPETLPSLWINPFVDRIEDFSIDDFMLAGYRHYPVLRGEVAV